MVSNLSQPPLTSQHSQGLEVLSVSDFFQQINWYAFALSGLDDVTLETSPYETVGQFFSTFPWQGTATAIPSNNWDVLASDEIDSTGSDTLTLEDLSALF